MVSFLLLGPLEVRVAGGSVQIKGSRQRVVLSLLLLGVGKVVSTERLATAVWGDEPPTTARAQIQISISKLRACLARLGLPDAIVTREPGYLIQLPESDIDAVRFSRMVANGRDAARRGEKATAARMLREALSLWRGDALTDIRSRLVRAVVLHLDEERLAVTEDCIDLELELGRHRELLGELRTFVDAHPLRERFHAQLMTALYRDGRQAEALGAYRRVRQFLIEQHGLDPGEELRALERAILEADPAVGAKASAETASPKRTVPRQLPARPTDLVGRVEYGRQMRAAVEKDGTRVLVISGPAGVGKTALAVDLAYALGEQLPDGHLFAHLRGADTKPVPSEQVLDYFLRALGLPVAAMPSDSDTLAGLYRSQLAGGRLVVVLDDAASARQVAPLLPADPGVAVIVTSRGPLPGLPNARRFELGTLRPEESLALLSRVVDASRVNAERDAAAVVAASCGHLPLALRIAAAKLAARPHWRIARMAARLTDESRRLDELSLDGAGVRASISVSLEALTTPARRLLLLLGSLGASDFASWVAGPLLDVDVYDGADALEELVDARLAEVQAEAGFLARYRLHDLVGVFARELLAGEVPLEERTAALHRLLRCWLHLAGQAHQREYGGDFTQPRIVAPDWPFPREVLDEILTNPISWYTSEQANLVAAIRLAAELDYCDLCCALAVTSVTFFEALAHREDWRETQDLALDMAVRHADRRAEAAVRCSRAGLALVEQRFAEAESDLSAALGWATAVGDAHLCGLAQRGLGSIDRLQGRYDEAQRRYEQAMNQLRESGDHVGIAHVLANLAQISAESGDSERAEQMLHQAMTICTRLGARRVMAQARCRLAQLYLDQGDLSRAEAEFASVLTTVTATEDPIGKAYALIGLGTVMMDRNDLGQATVLLTDALANTRQAGSRMGEGRALLALVELHRRTGDRSAVERYLQFADDAFTKIGAETWRARVDELRRQLADSRG